MGDEPKYSMYFAEFLGTYMLVFTVGCNVIDGNPVWFVVSIAAVLMVVTYALYPISRANFNPAVTLASLLSGKIGWADAAVYMVIQVVAGICAGFSYYGLYGKTFYLEPSPGYSWSAAFAAEGLYTFMYCFVFLNTACTRAHEGNQFYGLAIGFVVIAGGYAVGGISGGCFNPAVAFGIDIPSAGTGMGWSFWYLLFEFCGAIAAAGAFRLLRPAEFATHGHAQDDCCSKIPRAARQLLAEFLGTYFLVITVGFNVLGSSKAPAFSIAAALICMIYALGGDDKAWKQLLPKSISGAYFNPAVTVAVMLTGRDRIEGGLAMGMAYIVTQLLAGLCAGLTYSNVMGAAFTLGPIEPFGWAAAAAAEISFTFLLCFVVLCVATVRVTPCRDMFGLAIGSCFIVGGYAAGAISGGSLNPAISFGVDTAHSFKVGGWPMHCVFYTLFELVGAGLAAGMFCLTRPIEFTKGGWSLLPSCARAGGSSVASPLVAKGFAPAPLKGRYGS